MHRRLERQLKRCFGGVDGVPESARALVDLVDATYREMDEERALLEHSMETASRELVARNRELRRSEHYHRLLSENSSDVVTVVDARGAIRHVSPAVEHLLGYRPEDLRDTPIDALLHPDDRARMRAAFAEAKRAGRVRIVLRHRLRGRNGAWRVVESVGTDLLSDPVVAGVVVNSRDVTERDRIEEALRESEARFRSVVEGMGEGLLITDLEDRVHYANPRLEQMCGYTLDDMLGRRAYELLLPPERWPALAGRNERRAGGQADVYETEVRRGDGQAFWTLVHATPLRDAAGRVVGTIGALVDITERRRAEHALAQRTEQLEHSNRELEQFAYVASHDLQEPLRKIQAFGDRLRNRYGEALDERGRDYLERMQGAAGRMQTLIQDLLAFSRVASKPRPFEPVDLADVAREVVSDLEMRLQQSGGRVELDALPTVAADPLQMRQLLQNLIGNGLKFHRPGVAPVVAVRGSRGDTAAASSLVELTVADNGIGFDEKYLDRIFSPFQRLHGRGEYEGTGMGLAICRKIVDRHGGTITARSTPGAGATFVVTLPLAPNPAEHAHATAPACST